MKYDPPVILYIGQAQFMGYNAMNSVAMVTGQDISCAHTLTLEAVNILYMHIRRAHAMERYTCTVHLYLHLAIHLYSNYDTDVDVMRLPYTT